MEIKYGTDGLPSEITFNFDFSDLLWGFVILVLYCCCCTCGYRFYKFKKLKYLEK